MTYEEAWTYALRLYDLWSRAARNHNGYGQHTGERHYRKQLDEVVAEWGFQGTRVDPMVPWADRQGKPWSPPAPARIEVAA